MQEPAHARTLRACDQPPHALQIDIGWRAEEVAETKAAALRHRRVGGGVHDQIDSGHCLIETLARTQVSRYPLHIGVRSGSARKRANMAPGALEFRDEVTAQ